MRHPLTKYFAKNLVFKGPWLIINGLFVVRGWALDFSFSVLTRSFLGVTFLHIEHWERLAPSCLLFLI